MGRQRSIPTSIERERKFLVEGAVPGLKKLPHESIRQGYLAIEGPTEVRVREKGRRHVLTIKRGRGEQRQEVEFPLPPATFKQLWPMTSGSQVKKVRYKMRDGPLTIEIDDYRGELRGLRTAEVEFKSARQASAFTPPPWMGREVTGEKAFANQNLARSGLHKQATLRSRTLKR